MKPDPARIHLVIHMSPPHNIPRLLSCLGAVSYCGKFLKNMHEVLKPMGQLLKKNSKWEWAEKYQQSFNKFKEIISSFNPFQPKLNIDSSSRCFSNWYWFMRYSHIRRPIEESNISCLQSTDRNGTKVRSNRK